MSEFFHYRYDETMVIAGKCPHCEEDVDGEGKGYKCCEWNHDESDCGCGTTFCNHAC